MKSFKKYAGLIMATAIVIVVFSYQIVSSKNTNNTNNTTDFARSKTTIVQNDNISTMPYEDILISSTTNEDEVYSRNLQFKLQYAIEEIQGVDSANIEISIDNKSPSVSVKLILTNISELSNEQQIAIKTLITQALDNIEKENIVISTVPNESLQN